MTRRPVEMKESSVFSEKSILPACRIQCEPGCIKIGDKEYQSASEALNAYLDQFDTPETQSRYSLRSNNSLQSSVLKIQQHKIIEDEIQKAKQDIKIEVLKKALDKSKKREHGYLQKEVDDALAKSGELLERLNTTDDSIQQCPSDLGSLTTDILLTVNPYQDLKRSESKHVYSYHRTSRSPTPTIKSTSQSTNQNTLSNGSKSKLPPTGLGANKSKSNMTTCKNGRALRSRSVSPTSGKSFKTPSWVQELDNSSINGPPSWIDGLAASDISDSLWNDKTRINPQDDKFRTLPEETLSYLNSTTPGLNYSDLHSKTPDSKPQSFSELRTYTANLISKADKFLKESELIERKSLDTDMSSINQPSEMTPKRKGLHTTLDKYIADMSSPFSGKRDSESIENMPRCSSMDNMMGDDIGPKSDVTGASTIPMASNPVTPKKSGKPTVTFSPYHIGKSPNSSAILDGDRPWENSPLLKDPVHVDSMSPVPFETSNKISKSPTLSGGQQPGSLEALKKMLFKLQAESNTVQSDSYTSQNDINPADTLDMPALKGYNFESEPGGHSLEKALVHLSRLKSLVEKKDSFIQDSVLNKSSHSAPSSPRR
ncbi:hypothetical protein LOTGIDRAFT_228034 [Lottia gigantea]|uniref:Uncharacterized protein n=1 Tax=Lottia gigantea TaxID=225164 RepID=V4BHV2_LOTGI|nr:hypothetical protein LOTGIDRAFT_228034 [Lottia gigantea]ESP05457.1 hypothetical protein LOTGIDRAFT_228034 [Lottia gigantea]